MTTESVQIRLYYDPYTNYFGEGFCPRVEPTKSIRREILIDFTIDKNNYWRQSNKNEPCIYVLDQPEGERLLKLLNVEYSKSRVIMSTPCLLETVHLASEGVGIKNKYDLLLYPQINIFNVYRTVPSFFLHGAMEL